MIYGSAGKERQFALELEFMSWSILPATLENPLKHESFEKLSGFPIL